MDERENFAKKPKNVDFYSMAAHKKIKAKVPKRIN